MKKTLFLGVISALVILSAINSSAAPVDHVYVSSNKLDKLNLDGSLDMLFLPGSTDGTCRQLAVDGNTGNVWLACESAISVNNRVYLFDPSGNILRQCSNTPQFCAVVTLQGGMCIDPSGNAWITDRGNNQVYKYTPAGTRAGPYNVGGILPIAIACDSLGNVWTANDSSANVSKLNNSGSLLGTYPAGGWPKGIAIDSQNNIWVVNGNSAPYTNSVVKLSNSGTFIDAYPAGSNPWGGIAVDNGDNIWVTNSSVGISKLSNNGTILGSYPTALSPTQIAIDASGNVWVVSSSIMKFSNNGVNLGTFPLSGNSGMNDSGFLHKRFVLGYNSVDGPNVWIPLNGGAPAGAVTLTFGCISNKGNSSYTETGTGTPPPGGFKLGTPPQYYDITTTAVYASCNVEVCVGYNETEFTNEGALKLFHNSGAWEDVTTSLDTTNNIICGSVTSLSEFALMEPLDNGPIPTVSEWVLILMGALLLSAMAWRLRRERRGV